jgi:hypothetical protein
MIPWLITSIFSERALTSEGRVGMLFDRAMFRLAKQQIPRTLEREQDGLLPNRVEYCLGRPPSRDELTRSQNSKMLG